MAEGDIVTATDVIPIVDDSAGETKRSTSQAIVNAGLKAPGPIGGTTPGAVTATTVLSTPGVIGYTAGAGGTVTQSSWGTDVILNKLCGQIALFDSAVTAGVHFTVVYNSYAGTGIDAIVLTQVNGYNQYVRYSIADIGSGTFTICIDCAQNTSVSGVVLAFAMFKIATA